MSKIVRLTESDLIRLVKRVIKEQENEGGLNLGGKSGEELDKMLDDYWTKNQRPPSPKPKSTKKPFVTHKDVGSWYDAEDRAVEEPTDYSEEREFGRNEYENFMNYINDCDTRWCLKTKKFYDIYANKGNIKVRK